MKLDVPIRATVRCDDCTAGTSEAVVLDPLTRTVTHVVVRDQRWPRVQRLVPVCLIAWTTDDEIHLGVPVAIATKQEPFLETEFAEVPRVDPEAVFPIVYGRAFLWPYAYPKEKVPVTRERIRRDELAIRRGTTVVATDGRVGRVEALLVDREDDHITHIVVASEVLRPEGVRDPDRRRR